MKSGSCTICDDPRRSELEQSHFAGVSPRDLAKQFGRNKDTVQKHVTHAEVATLVGYSDQSHFSAAFKRERGIPPARYRQSLRR